MLVIDYTNGWGGFAGAADVKAHGFDGIMRYLSHNPAKDLTAAERDEARAHGLSIGLVFESTARRASEGHDAGRADAVFANARAGALGYPAECTLWYAVDFDAAPSQVQPYFDGIGSEPGRTHAPYGGVRVIDGVSFPGRGWQTVAWSHGRVSARAGLLQSGFHGSYDTNQVLAADYGQWHQQGDDVPLNDADLKAIRGLFTVTDSGGATHDSIIDNWNRLANLEAVAHRDIDVLQPILDQIKADVENPNSGGGAGQITPAQIDAIAKAVLDAEAARLQS